MNEVGVLEDYSSKYLLIRQVSIQDKDLRHLIEGERKNKRNLYDFLYSRSSTIIRNTLKD